MRRLSFICAAVSAAAISLTAGLSGAEPELIDDATFQKLHHLIRRQPGESRWMEIDWYPSVWEARQKAAELGRPLLLMAGSGGAPAAGC